MRKMMMETPRVPAAPSPGPEHERLRAFEGSWDFLATFEGEAPSRGVSTCTLDYGGFWLMQEDLFHTEGGSGHGMIGFDPGRGKYVLTGICSMGPGICIGWGQADPSGKVFTFDGEWTHPTTNRVHRARMVYEFLDDDHLNLTFTENGRPIGRFTYTRKSGE